MNFNSIIIVWPISIIFISIYDQRHYCTLYSECIKYYNKTLIVLASMLIHSPFYFDFKLYLHVKILLFLTIQTDRKSTYYKSRN